MMCTILIDIQYLKINQGANSLREVGIQHFYGNKKLKYVPLKLIYIIDVDMVNEIFLSIILIS